MPNDGHLGVSRFGGRRPQPTTELRPLRSRLAAWPALVVMILAAIFGGWVVTFPDRFDGEVRHVDHDYRAGEVVPLGDLRIQVVDLSAAETVDGVFTPGGVQVVLRLRVENHGEQARSIRNAELLDPAGYTFITDSSTPSVAPGFVSSYDLGFLVDPHRLEGLALRVDNRQGIYTFADERAVQDLAIDAARAEELRATAAGLSVELRPDETEGM